MSAPSAFWRFQFSARRPAAALCSSARVDLPRQKALGADILPSNDFSLYDHVLDTSALIGAVPPRYDWAGESVDPDLYFAMARGAQQPAACGHAHGGDTTAMEMTKWFDTNYHFLVPFVEDLGRGDAEGLAGGEFGDHEMIIGVDLPHRLDQDLRRI